MAKGGGVWNALSSPTGWILAGGIVYLAYQIFLQLKKAKEDLEARAKDVAEGFNPNSSVLGSSQPIGPAPAGDWITARILEPANNGVAERGFFDRKFRVSVQLGNGGNATVVNVAVKVTVTSRLTGTSEVLQSSQQLSLPKGTKVFEFWFHLMTPITHDGVAEVYIDGKSMAVPALFTID